MDGLWKDADTGLAARVPASPDWRDVLVDAERIEQLRAFATRRGYVRDDTSGVWFRPEAPLVGGDDGLDLLAAVSIELLVVERRLERAHDRTEDAERREARRRVLGALG